jgi:catechol 2,3-dioxygenase-like lactoylglutathione lyase family enzyme
MEPTLSIFDHITIAAEDVPALSLFYQAALSPLGIEQKFMVKKAGGTVAAFGLDRTSFFITGGLAPSPIHLAFAARSRSQVDAFHAQALAAGGRDNGAPGIRDRYHTKYYAAFVIDPAGNNVEAVYQN